MSASGISVFYGALDSNTARTETTFSLDSTRGRTLTCATWTNTREMTVLDLTRLPEPPSFYAQLRYDREHLLFLRQFVEDITKRVAHDGMEHIE